MNDGQITQVKICGVTTLEDALAAAQAGATLIGLNFYSKSPRYLDIPAARAIADGLRAALGTACPILVGVFVNEVVGRISITMEKVGLKAAQLSGDESVEMLKELRGTAFKAIRPRTQAEALDDAAYFAPGSPVAAALPALLIDAYHPDLYGGTGETASIETALAVKAVVPRLMLAGGLTPDNVAARVAAIRPYAVDVASGVEIVGQPGRKDHDKVRDFIAAAQL